MQRSRSSTARERGRKFSRRGQSMLELALLLPVLLLLIAGIVEIVAYTIDYMAVLDASREAARYGTSLDPDLTSYHALDMRSCTDDSFCDCDESKGKCNAFPNVRPPGFEDGDMPPEDLVEICDKGNTTNFYYELGCLVVQWVTSTGPSVTRSSSVSSASRAAATGTVTPLALRIVGRSLAPTILTTLRGPVINT
jgi:hypothetical protein